MKAKDRLLSWRHAPPKTAAEQATARLLEEMRSAPTLSPEAFARIERRLREKAHRPQRRPVLSLAGLWTPALAGAAATVLVAAAFTFVTLRREALLGPVAVPVPSARVAEAVVERAQPPPPESEVATKKSEVATRSVAKRTPVERTSRSEGLVAASEAAPAAPFAVANKPTAAPSGGAIASGGAASSDRRLQAASESAPPRVGSPALIARAEQLARMGRCKEAVDAFTSAMEGTDQDPVVERALYGRARCRLTLGEQPEAERDLHDYLSRFPEGRFAAEARRMLH